MTSHPRDPGWQRVASYLRGLDHALAARLIPLLFPSIRLHSHQVAEPEAIAVGASRLGGCPALPPGVSWPRVEGRALPFLGQFALEEVAPYDLQHVLPAGGGLLSFFYSPDLDLEIELGRGDPTRKDDWRAWRVCVFPSGVSLELAPPPISLLPQEQFFPCTVSFHLEWMLPWWESPQLAQLDLEADYYGTLCQTIAALQPEAQDSQGCLHRLFGYPQAIQGDVFDLLS